jgi:hypothetical protein
LELQKSILNLLPKKFDVQGEIYDKFNLGYEKAINEIAFIPSQYAKRLLKVHNRPKVIKNQFLKNV